ncbi:MAG: PAS domain S-box protein [bacterium]|nr:PAS domain S-box protein [bacterium]
MSPVALLHYTLFVIYIFLTLFVFLKNKYAILNRVCALLILCFSVWSLGPVLLSNKDISSETARVFSHIGSIGWITFPGIYLWFILVYTGKKKLLQTWVIYPGLFIPPLLFLYLKWSNILMAGYAYNGYLWHGVWSQSIWPILFHCYYISFVCLSLYVLFSFIRKTKNKTKQKQARIIFTTTVIALILGTTSNAILPQLGIYTLQHQAITAIIIWVYGLVYATVRYQLLGLSPTLLNKNIIATIPDSLMLLNENGIIIFANKQAEKLLGYSKSGLSGLSAGMLFEQTAKDQSQYTEILTGEDFKNKKVSLKTEQGAIVPVNLSRSIMVDTSEDVSGILCVAEDLSNLENKEKELRESEIRYESLFNSSLQSIYLNDLEGNFIDANDAALELTGYSREEIQSLNFAALVDEDELLRVIGTLQEILKTGRQREMHHYKIKSKDGTYKYIETESTIIYSNGEPRALQGTARDITERIKAEEALKDSEERFRELAELLPQGVFETDTCGKFTYANKWAQDRFAISPDKPEMGLLSFDIISPEDRETAMRNFKQVLNDEKRSTQEYTATKRDGTPMPIIISADPIIREGEAVGIRGTVLDITESKKMTDALRKSEEQYRTILENIVDGYYELDLKGNFIFFNKAMCDILDYTEEEPLTIFSIKYLHRNGTEHFLEISIDLIKNEQGEKTGFRGIIRDATHKMKYINMLQKRNDEIQKDLQTAQLIQRSLVSIEIPIVPEVHIDYRYFPLKLIGGDYFSFTPLTEGGLAAFVGDVANHGVTAALFLSLIRATTDRLGRAFALHPKEYLRLLNDELFDNMPMSFLTAIYGIFQYCDPEKSRVKFTFSNGGHPYPILYRTSTRKVEEMRSKGKLIGILEEIDNEEYDIFMEKGDRLFIYTDGIPETMNKKEEFLGFDYLPELLSVNASCTLSETLDFVINEINRFKGNIPFEDDIVIIGFEVG